MFFHFSSIASSLVLFAGCRSRSRMKHHHAVVLLHATQEVSQETAAASPLRGKAKFDALLDWIGSQDGSEIHPNVQIRPSNLGGGFGAFVSDEVAKDEILFQIPRSACITIDDAMNDKDCDKSFRKVIEKAGPGGSMVVMAGLIAKERLQSLEYAASKENPSSDDKPIEDSRFGPYLATLPWQRGVNNQEHTLFWTDEMIDELLTGSMCYNEAAALRSEVALAIRVLDGIVGPAIRELRGEESKSGFRWPWEVYNDPQPENPRPVEGLPEAVKGAFVSLLTRAFQDGEDSDNEKMVPLLDLLQHSEKPNISHVMRKEDGTVEVRARRDLKSGEELFNQYRSEFEESMPYHRFFTRFGFVPTIQEPVENLLKDKSSIFFAQKAEV